MPLKSDYNHIICIMEGEMKNIRFVLKIYRFVLRLLNISFCGLYGKIKKWFPKINALDYERKIFDECISFLDNVGLPYHDLKVYFFAILNKVSVFFAIFANGYRNFIFMYYSG